MIYLYTLGGAFVLLLAVVIIRALMFNPKPLEAVESEEISLDKEKIVNDMSDMIKCKTVSYKDHSLEDEVEFEKFRSLLKERFPLVHKSCSLEHIGRNGLLYKLEGDSSEKPSVCMAHYDVVPVNEDGWEKDPFGAEIEKIYFGVEAQLTLRERFVLYLKHLNSF